MQIGDTPDTKPAAGRDRHQAGDDARGGAEVGGVAVADPLDDHPGQAGRGGGEERVHERLDGLAVGRERRAGVEPEPAEPEDAGADHHQRHGVRRVALLRPALALAEHQHRGQRGDAGVDVDRGAAGEVERAALAEPAAEHPLEDGQYTSSDHTGTKIAHAENFIRSATAPLISAGVMAANMPRKAIDGELCRRCPRRCRCP